MKPRREPFAFDVALSFAGSDRRHAEALRTALTSRGLKVFYDRDYTAHLWGKRQEEYEAIYGPRSRYFVPIISEHYPKRHWTQLELAFAKREAERRNEEFILPVRLDDTIVLGIADDVQYISLTDDFTAEQIASELVRKIEGSNSDRSAFAKSSGDTLLLLLGKDVRSVLELLATALWPISLDVYKTLFPKLPWEHAFRELVAAELLSDSADALKLPRKVKTAVLTGIQDVKAVHQQWVNALQSAGWHIDLIYMLSFHRMAAGDLIAATMTLSEMAGSGNLGRWSSLYLSALLAFSSSSHWRRLSTPQKCQVLNSVARCQTNLGQRESAAGTLSKLLAFARRHKDRYWVGQTLLNLGVDAARSDRKAEAGRWYRQARRHAERYSDNLLMGRVLGNLSQLAADEDLQEATRLQTLSLEYKRKAKDKWGVAVGLAQSAALAAKSGDLRASVSKYRRALSQLQKLGMEEELANTQLQLAQVLLDLHDYPGALAALDACVEICDVWSYDLLLTLALERRSQAYYVLKEYDLCSSDCEQLLLLSRTSYPFGVASALHGLGVVELLRGNVSAASRRFASCIRFSTQHHFRDWILRCRVDRRRVSDSSALTAPSHTALIKDAKRLVVSGDTLSAAELYEWVGQNASISEDNVLGDAEYLRTAADLYLAIDDVSAAALCLAQVADAHERIADYAGALDALEQAGNHAQARSDTVLYVQLLNQRATLLLDLREDEAAMPLLEQACSLIASDTTSVHGTTLHNLGEAYRRNAHYSKATRVLQKAEDFAISRGDHAAAIDSRHSRALVAQHEKKFAEASSLFRRCRRDASRYGISDEYVRAWEAMAGLAWARGDRVTARSRYKRALDEANSRSLAAMAAHIALNYASLLFDADEDQAAFDVLEPHASSFSRLRRAYLYHSQLAAISHACGKTKIALAQCHLGIRSADAAGSAGYQAICRGYLGEILNCEGRYAEAIPYLEAAIPLESDLSDSVQLRYALLDALLHCNNESRAEAVLADAMEIAEHCELYESIVDLQMRVFDHNWRDGWDGRSNAVQNLAASIAYAIHGELSEVLVQVVMHVVATMTSGRRPLAAAKLAALVASAEAWSSDPANGLVEISDIIVGPLRMGQQLQRHVADRRELERESLKLFDKYWADWQNA